MSTLLVRHASLIVAHCALLAAGCAHAFEIEPLDAVRLIVACENFSRGDAEVDNFGADAVMCRSYLQGFFAATDEVVTTERIPSALTIRVLKTRGARVSEGQKKFWEAAYCISETESLRDIARKISEVDKFSADNKSAQNLLRETLAEHYDCAKVRQNPGKDQ